jgi:lysophospholipase L1-like esterase
MIFKIFNKKLLVVFVVLIICFLLGELSVRLYLRHKIFYDIEMVRYSMLIKTESMNPKIGHVHRPNATAHLMGVLVRTNSDGLRDQEYPLQRTNKKRIVFLGDSMTFGWGVEHEDTFENVLERELNNPHPTEIINMGAGNYNTEQQVNLFLEKGLKYNPDKVVLFYSINDAEITPKKSRFWFLSYSRLISFYWSRIHSALSNLLQSKSFYSYNSDLYRDNQPGWINTKKAFLQLRDICQKNNIDLQIVLLPELPCMKNFPMKNEHDLITTFFGNNGIDHFDLAPFFADYENPMELWVSYDDAHPNKLGHKMIAEYTLDFIK